MYVFCMTKAKRVEVDLVANNIAKRKELLSGQNQALRNHISRISITDCNVFKARKINDYKIVLYVKNKNLQPFQRNLK